MVFIRSLAAALVLASMMGTTMADGSYWAVYNATAGPAEAACLVEAGTMVDVSCCTDEDAAITKHDDLRGDDTCFSLGPGLIPFSGCVSDGVYGYGENCDGGDGTPPFVAADAEECGCDFVIEGSGCYKANDIPGQQWFVFLDAETCKSPTAAPTSGTAMMMMTMTMSSIGGMSAWTLSLFAVAAIMI